MKPTEMKILVIGDRCWGKADTLGQALSNMRKVGGRSASKQYIAYVVHPDSGVDEVFGGITYPTKFPPKEFHRVGFKKQKGAKS